MLEVVKNDGKGLENQKLFTLLKPQPSDELIKGCDEILIIEGLFLDLLK